MSNAQEYQAEVVGRLWMGGIAATRYNWNVGNIIGVDEMPETELVEYLIDTHIGDFSEVLGARIWANERGKCGHYHADRLVQDFPDEEVEMMYNDAMYPGDE